MIEGPTTTEMGIDPSELQAETETPIDASAEPAVPQTDESTEDDVPTTEAQQYEPEARTIEAEQRKDEITSLGRNLLYRKTGEINQRRTDNPDQKAQISEEPSVKALDNYNKLYNLKDKAYGFTNGTPLLIKFDGQPFQVAKVYRREGDDFICDLRPRGGQGRILDGQAVPTSLVLAGQLQAESDGIVSNFAGDERKAMELFIKIQSGATPAELDNKSLDETITRSAENAGIMTAKDIDGFFGALAARGELPPEMQATITEVQALMSGKNILDAAAASEIVQKLGVNPEALQGRVTQLQTELGDAQTALDANPADAGLQDRVKVLQEELDMTTKAQELLSKPDAFKVMFDAIIQADIPQETAKMITEAIRTGNMKGALALVRDNLKVSEADTPDEAADKHRRAKELSGKLAKGAGIGMGIFFVLMWELMTEESKAIKKSIR